MAEAVRADDAREPGPGRREPDPRWHPVLRVLFRFAFVFVGIGMAATYLAPVLLVAIRVPRESVAVVAKWLALHPLTDWVGREFFGVRVDYRETGSGDTAAHWISVFTWLLVAIVVTVVWSGIDRRRAYPRLYAWFRLLLRATLIAGFLLYGMIKILPSQMSFNLERLVEPFGDMSPMAVLWAQSGLSQPYEMALGAAEVTAALLLILPFTAGLGAVLTFIVAMQVFLLNLTFDVPVKLFSGQLFLYAAILAAPDILRIVRTLLGHAVPARTREPLLTSARGLRILLIAQVIFGLLMVYDTIDQGYDAWHTWGSARPHSPLYGIWNVTEYAVDGTELPPLVDFDTATPDNAAIGRQRFRRILFDTPDVVTAQRMNDSLLSIPAHIDTTAHTIRLSGDLAQHWTIATLNYEQPQPDRLTLTGQLAGRPVHMQLDRVDLDTYPVVSRGFHWVQAVPYLR
ncbi:DoxX family protein [Nocardia sp. NPDC020380]|uniref:DoxX family protein n=1 Tax=Nocardia sp. NPDC020380 TaxID=3364309 RepID=UPI0037B3047C